MTDRVHVRLPLTDETRAAKMADPRPWLDVRPSEYVTEDYIATHVAAKAILQRCLDEGLRLRVHLDEAVDLLQRSRDPLLPSSYQLGYSGIHTEAVEIVIHRRDGRRYLVTGLHGQERGYV